MTAWYNENDPYCAQWLRNLVAAGLIAPGYVDERDIRDVRPDDLKSYRQCHFFAGIGGWSCALRLAAVPDHFPVWTGSCPCQPFSNAGKQGGFVDERHLWPSWYHLIAQCRPGTILGEQVAGKSALDWLDLVQADLEVADYAVASADLCAAGIAAPHIRQRLCWVANAQGAGRWPNIGTIRTGAVEGVCDSQRKNVRGTFEQKWDTLDSSAKIEGLDNPAGARPLPGTHRGISDAQTHPTQERGRDGRGPSRSGRALNFWADAEWIPCIDGKSRPAQPGIFPLAHGVPARVAKLRAIGNAIVPQVAAEFIKAALIV